ncbi:MAG: nicotinate-nucleotide adenylyltransferase [Synergistaceae bacterium]|nr:nicotinate-nucleotide adenylyltransferase [Synergistaceae bacterium]
MINNFKNFIKKLGIMGGTFDPIHLGHLFAADTAYHNLQLDEVLFVPSGNPPHKSGHVVVDAELRLEMVYLATKDVPYFTVSDIEVKKEGKSYTVDTLRAIKKMPKYVASQLFFITGLDAACGIATWREPEQILSMCNFVSITRAHTSLKKFNSLPKKLREKVILLKEPELEISSTDIKYRIQNHKSVRFMFPTEVFDFIVSHRLYDWKG